MSLCNAAREENPQVDKGRAKKDAQDILDVNKLMIFTVCLIVCLFICAFHIKRILGGICFTYFDNISLLTTFWFQFLSLAIVSHWLEWH